MKTTTIYHPKTKLLKGYVTKLDEPTIFGDFYESEFFGMQEWHLTFQEAKEEVFKLMNDEYIGQAGKERNEAKQYEQSEKRVCGNY